MVASSGDPKRIAKGLLAKARRAEPRITADVTEAIEAAGAQPARLGSELKSEGSLARKVADRQALGGFRPHQQMCDHDLRSG